MKASPRLGPYRNEGVSLPGPSQTFTGTPATDEKQGGKRNIGDGARGGVYEAVECFVKNDRKIFFLLAPFSPSTEIKGSEKDGAAI